MGNPSPSNRVTVPWNPAPWRSSVFETDPDATEDLPIFSSQSPIEIADENPHDGSHGENGIFT